MDRTKNVRFRPSLLSVAALMAAAVLGTGSMPLAAQGPGQAQVQRVSSANNQALRMLDTRGEGEDSGLAAAVSASKHQYVVLLVRGRDDAIVNGAKQALQTLLDLGYEKIGLILTDEAPARGRLKNNMTILSAGKAAAQVKDAGADDSTKAMIVRLVRHVYDRELGVPARVQELEQNLARLQAEREALVQRQQDIERERQEIQRQRERLEDERLFIQRQLREASTTGFARRADGGLVNTILEAVIASIEASTGRRIDRGNTAQIVSALQGRLAQIDEARGRPGRP